MLLLLRLFWPICRLRQGPQDLPASPALLHLLVGLCLLAGVLSFSISQPLSQSLLRAVVSMAISLGIWLLLLRLLVAPARRLQTLTAIYGCALILNLLLLPVAVLLEQRRDAPGLLPLLLLAMLVWGQIINGHILRHALNWPLAAGVAVAVAVFVLRYGSFAVLFS